MEVAGFVDVVVFLGEVVAPVVGREQLEPVLDDDVARQAGDLRAAPGGPGVPLRAEHPAPEGQQYKFEELQSSDVQLLGRITYQEFAGLPALLALCLVAKRTIAEALDLLGISAPERM